MKRKRDNDGKVSVTNYSNQYILILNPKKDISIVSIKEDSKISYNLPAECIENYQNKYYITPLISDNSISKFVFSKKNQIYVLNIGEDLTIQNTIKSRSTILSVSSGRLINNDWTLFTTSAHEKNFRLELRLSKNLEIIETLNISQFDDYVEILDFQFIHDNKFQDNFDIIIILYRIKDEIKFALVSVTSRKLAILRHISLSEKLKMKVDNFFSPQCWIFTEKSNVVRATWDPTLLDFSFDKFSDFDGNFFISHEIWGKYKCNINSITIKLYKLPNNLLLDKVFPITCIVNSIYGGIIGNNVLLVLISIDGEYETISLNTDSFNKISTASKLAKAIRSFNNNVDYLNLKDLNVDNVRKLFELETLRDEDAVKILLKDPELLLPVFIESFNISPNHLIIAFKKNLNQKFFEIIIIKLLDWINSFNSGLELKGLSESCNFDHLIWIKIVDLTCCILDSTVNSEYKVTKSITDELIKLTKDVCKLQKILQHMYSRVIMLTSASHFHDSRKYNSNKLLETFTIDL